MIVCLRGDYMAYKDKSQMYQYNNEYNKGKYDRVALMLPKGYKTRINAARGEESANSWIKGAIDAKLKESERVEICPRK